MSGKKNLHEGNILYFSLKVYKKTGTKKVRQCIPLLSWKVRKGVKTIGSCFRLTKWKNVVATKIIGVEPGSSARASNSLTTASQCLICFDKLVLLYQNHLLCDVTLAGRRRLKTIEPPPPWSKLSKAVILRWLAIVFVPLHSLRRITKLLSHIKQN